jgi:hypothetical protein
MRTYPIVDDHGRLVAFEVPNAYVGIGAVARLLRGVRGVSEVRRRALFGGPDDVHVAFQYDGTPFMVWEPYGDSSRYWIGPKAGVSAGIDVAELHGVFQRYRPFLLRRLLGHALYVFSMEWIREGNR